MRNFIDFLSEAKLEPGGEDLSKLFGPKGKFSPKSKDAPKEPTAFQRSVQAGRMGVGDFAKMVKGIFGPPSGDVKEPTTKSNADILRDKLRDAGKEMKKTDITPDLQKKIDAVKGMRGNGKKKDGIVGKISSFFNHTAEGAQGKLPKNIAASLNDHLARLHGGFFSDNRRRPTQQEATKMAHEVVDDHFAGVERTLRVFQKEKKTQLTSKSGIPVKITHFESMRENPHAHYGPFGQAMKQVDDSGPMPDGRHLVVHVDHHHTGIYNINNDHSHAQHIAKQLKATTGHDWFHVPYSEGVKIRGKKVVFRGNKSSPMMFTTAMTHRDIDLGDGDHDGGGDDDGGPDEPKPIVPTGPRTKRPQLV
jgi:hypothetical protein